MCVKWVRRDICQVCSSSSAQLEAADRIVALKVVQALLSADHKRAASHFLKGCAPCIEDANTGRCS